MKKINLKNILAISLLFLLAFNARAEYVIRDSEIENVIKEAINPLSKAASLEDVKIILIQNNEVNAFTAGSNEIFVNTGLISNFPDPDVFKGVMAHEMGHIIGHHVARSSADIDNIKKKALAGLALGIVGSIASGNPEILAAGAMTSSDAAEKSFLKYSRTYESSADQAAYRLLEESGNSAIGMKKLFEYFLDESRGRNLDPYLLTHPVSSERLKITEEFIKTSKYQKSTSSDKLKKRFERIAFKLLAFTHSSPEMLLSKINLIENSDIRLYVKAICNMRLAKLGEAISAIDSLLAKYPNDPYFTELKGEIFFSFGKKESITYFDKASKLLPGDNLMKFNRSIVALNTYRYDNKEKLNDYIDGIKSMKSSEPDSLPPYYYLAQYYGILGEESLSKLYLAIFYDKQGNKDAKRFARASLSGLEKESPEYYWAMDIIDKE